MKSVSRLVVFGALALSLAPSVHAQSARELVEKLAAPAWRGRGSGEKGNEAAAKFVAEQFQKAGLKPLAPGYLQPFSFAYALTAGKNNRLTVGGKRYRAGVEFEPHPLSGTGAASGALVFGLEGGDVTGKVVVLEPQSADSNALAGQIGTARDKKAAAVLVVPALGAGNALREADPSSADAAIPVLLVKKNVADAWKSLSGPVNVTLAAEVRHEKRVTSNVIGILEGSDPLLKNEYVVVGGHLDHLGMGGTHSLAADRTPRIHPGADDNASGTAGVILAARQLAGSSLRPRRSVIFMGFSGEELGLLGSQHYVNHPLVPLDKTVAMFNLDMIGRLRNNKLSALGVGTAAQWPELLDAANATAKFSLSRDEGSFGGSDHQSFAAKNVPVLFFFTGLHEDYHRPSDTPDKIDGAGIERIATLTASLARTVADTPVRPTFQQVTVAAPGRTRARASLGSIPEYGVEVVGVLLSGVRPGSPAEKAGLQAGDVIVKFGGRTVRNIEEYTAALGEFSPGDTVEIVVTRGGKEVTVKATLAESKR